MVFFALLDDEVEMIKSCICEQSKSIDYVLPLRYSSCLLFALLIRPIMDEKLKLSKYWCLSWAHNISNSAEFEKSESCSTWFLLFLLVMIWSCLLPSGSQPLDACLLQGSFIRKTRRAFSFNRINRIQTNDVISFLYVVPLRTKTLNTGSSVQLVIKVLRVRATTFKIVLGDSAVLAHHKVASWYTDFSVENRNNSWSLRPWLRGWQASYNGREQPLPQQRTKPGSFLLLNAEV